METEAGGSDSDTDSAGRKARVAPAISVQGTKSLQRPEQLDIASLTAEEKDWRNRLGVGCVIDATQDDKRLSLEGWAKAEIVGVVGGDPALPNLGGDNSGDKVKMFRVEYVQNGRAPSRHFRADSPYIARYDTRTGADGQWRSVLQVGDEVDFMRDAGEWVQAEVLDIDRQLDSYEATPDMELGTRAFRGGRTIIEPYRLRVPLYSIRVQRAFTMGPGSTSREKMVWNTETDLPSMPGPESYAPQEPALSAEEKLALEISKLAEQDREDMAMLEETDGASAKRFFAVIRPSCKSTFFIELVDKLGTEGVFDALLAALGKPGTGLEETKLLLRFFMEGSDVYHKQFVDAVYQRMRDAVEAKLTTASPALLDRAKIGDIEEIVRLVRLLEKRLGTSGAS